MIPFMLGIVCGAAIMFVCCWMNYLTHQHKQWVKICKGYQQRIRWYDAKVDKLQNRINDPLDLGENDASN